MLKSQNSFGWERSLTSSSPTTNLRLPSVLLNHVPKHLIWMSFKWSGKAEEDSSALDCPIILIMPTALGQPLCGTQSTLHLGRWKRSIGRVCLHSTPGAVALQQDQDYSCSGAWMPYVSAFVSPGKKSTGTEPVAAEKQQVQRHVTVILSHHRGTRSHLQLSGWPGRQMPQREKASFPWHLVSSRSLAGGF